MAAENGERTVPEGMLCPFCKSYTGYAPVEQAKQVQLNTPGNWGRVHLASGSVFDPPSGMFFGVTRCQSCGQAFPIRGKARNAEHPDASYEKGTLTPLWPPSYRSVPPEIPSHVREAMEDASRAIGAGSVVGGMLAARTAIIRALRQMKDELKLDEASLKALYNAGRISRFEFESSDLARRWANHLGHEEPDPNKSISMAEAQEFYGYVESLLDTLFVKWRKLSAQQAKLKGHETAPTSTGGRSKAKGKPAL